MFSSFAKAWRYHQRQAWKDLHSHWRRAFFPLLVTVLITGLFAMYISPGFFTSKWRNRVTACTTSGQFQISIDNSDIWAISGFFQITLGLGEMSFSEAKIIDVAWDLLFARGGQAILAYFSFRVFAKYVTTSMEVTPVTFHTYRAIFIQDAPSLVSTLKTIRDFCFRQRLHSIVAMVFMAMTMTFILAFSTFGSALSGYSPNVVSCVYVDEDVIPFYRFNWLGFIIHDGDRVGLDADYVVPWPFNKFSEPTLDSLVNNQSRIDCNVTSDYTEGSGQCTSPFALVSTYIAQYGDPDISPQDSYFNGTQLEAPQLHITKYFTSKIIYNSASYEHIDLLNIDISHVAWTVDGKWYDQAYLETYAMCQNNLTYQWGFSVLQLNIMIILLILWLIGIITMWLRATTTMKLRGRETVSGEYKALLDISDAIRSQPNGIPLNGTSPKDVDSLTEQQLYDHIAGKLKGGAMTYVAPILSNGDAHNGSSKAIVKAWLLEEKWWLLAILLLICGSIALYLVDRGIYMFYGWAVPASTLISVLAFTIGSTGRSRAMLILWMTPVVFIIPQCVFIVVLSLPSS